MHTVGRTNRQAGWNAVCRKIKQEQAGETVRARTEMECRHSVSSFASPLVFAVAASHIFKDPPKFATVIFARARARVSRVFISSIAAIFSRAIRIRFPCAGSERLCFARDEDSLGGSIHLWSRHSPECISVTFIAFTDVHSSGIPPRIYFIPFSASVRVERASSARNFGIYLTNGVQRNTILQSLQSRTWVVWAWLTKNYKIF